MARIFWVLICDKYERLEHLIEIFYTWVPNEEDRSGTNALNVVRDNSCFNNEDLLYFNGRTQLLLPRM